MPLNIRILNSSVAHLTNFTVIVSKETEKEIFFNMRGPGDTNLFIVTGTELCPYSL
jgi:hypothetical protein